MQIMKKSDDGKQKSRQSTDFKEIWSTQSEMNVSQKLWDRLFHNWDDPKNCVGGKKIMDKCTVCEELKSKGFVKDTKENIRGVNILVVGDLHSNYLGLQKLIKENPDCTAVICVGDLALWKTQTEARVDGKAFSKTATNILEFINNPQAFDIPVYVVKGNHDDYNNMYTDFFKNLNIHYLKQGEILTFANVNIGTIGGIFSPVRISGNSSNFKGRENRFYTQIEIDSLKGADIDYLITHQAPLNCIPAELSYGKDEGSKELEELLKSFKKTVTCIHGHHHKNYSVNNKIGLGNFSKNEKSYIKINTLTKQSIITE